MYAFLLILGSAVCSPFSVRYVAIETTSVIMCEPRNCEPVQAACNILSCADGVQGHHHSDQPVQPGQLQPASRGAGTASPRGHPHPNPKQHPVRPVSGHPAGPATTRATAVSLWPGAGWGRGGHGPAVGSAAAADAAGSLPR